MSLYLCRCSNPSFSCIVVECMKYYTSSFSVFRHLKSINNFSSTFTSTSSRTKWKKKGSIFKFWLIMFWWNGSTGKGQTSRQSSIPPKPHHENNHPKVENRNQQSDRFETLTILSSYSDISNSHPKQTVLFATSKHDIYIRNERKGGRRFWAIA